MKDTVLYIHGKGGSAAESRHYQALFPDCGVYGLDYQTSTPWETGAEIHAAAERLKAGCDRIILIANSIGAYFSMHAGLEGMTAEAYFISPIVNMERLILDMLARANAAEEELKIRQTLPDGSDGSLSWDYLCYVRSHPVQWSVPTQILYGSDDDLTPDETIRNFAKKHHAGLTVMAHGAHWFHTEEQMRFLDDWIRRCQHG